MISKEWCRYNVALYTWMKGTPKQHMHEGCSGPWAHAQPTCRSVSDFIREQCRDYSSVSGRLAQISSQHSLNATSHGIHPARFISLGSCPLTRLADYFNARPYSFRGHQCHQDAAQLATHNHRGPNRPLGRIDAERNNSHQNGTSDRWLLVTVCPAFISNQTLSLKCYTRTIEH